MMFKKILNFIDGIFFVDEKDLKLGIKITVT